MIKKRSQKTQIAEEGVIHVRKATHDAGHIFREVLKEDIGIDAHIEICHNSEPTGILIGLQIKSGESYFRSETPESFAYYPKIDDLKYWHEYLLPVFLVIYRPLEKRAYWVDVKEFLKEHKFEDMLSGVTPKKIVLDKRNLFSKNFFDILEERFGDQRFDEYWYNLALQSLLEAASTRSGRFNIPLNFRRSLFHLNISSATKLSKYLNSRRNELVRALVQRAGLKETLAEKYVTELVVKLRALIFELERSGFILMAFEQKEDRDLVGEHLEALIPFNRYLILKGERLFLQPSLMNYFLLVASDGWSKGEVNLGEKFFPKLEQRFGLRWLVSYEFDFYDPIAASIFLTPNYCFRYIFETICDTKDNLLLFDHLRALISYSQEGNSEDYLWVSIGDERVNICWSWDPALFWYFHCIRAIRTGGKWLPFYDFFLEVEFGISSEGERKDFVAKAKVANSLQELPLMTKSMLENIKEGTSRTSKGFR